MAWSYNNTTSVLTSTGATEASPDSLLAGIAIVQAANASRAYRFNQYGRLDSVRVDVALSSWVIFDDNGQFEFTGSTRMNPANESSANANNGGSMIFGFRMVLITNTSSFLVDSNCQACGSGGNFISRRSSSGINPLVIQQTGTRNDFPTFSVGYTPNRIDIGGLTIRNNGASRKVYFGRARNLVKAENVNFETTTGEYQTAQTVYQASAFPVANHKGDDFVNTSSFYNTRWGTEQTGTIQFNVSSSVRLGNYINYDPIFPTATWDGTYTAGNWSGDDRYAAALYTSRPTFKAGVTLLSGVNVRWAGVLSEGTRVYNLANIGESLTKTAVTNGTGTVSNYLLSAMRGREAGVQQSSNKYRWTLKARSHNFRAATENIWESKSFLSDGDNGPLEEEVTMVPLPFAPATLAAGLAVTGVSFDSAGNCTLTANRTALEIFQAWCSASRNNLDMPDVWRYDGVTLNMGAANLSGTGTAAGNFTTTDTITAPVNGTYTDANNAGQIVITGPAAADTVEMRKASDNSLIATRTGPGAFAVAPANVGVSVYFERKVGPALVMSTVTKPVALTAGVNANVALFAGDEVQVANADDLPGRVWAHPTRTLNGALFE